MLRFELDWAADIARTLLPRGALGGLMDDKDLPALFAADCRASPWQANLVLRLSLWLTWFSPVWMRGRAATFGGLGAPEREEQLERLFASRVHLVRLTMLYFKLMACSLLMGDERVLARLGAYQLPRLEDVESKNGHPLQIVNTLPSPLPLQSEPSSQPARGADGAKERP